MGAMAFWSLIALALFLGAQIALAGNAAIGFNASLPGNKVYSENTSASLTGRGLQGGPCGMGGGQFGTDPCFIHKYCDGGAGYSNDGQYVDSNTAFDACAIHPSCTCGSASFHGIG